MDSHTVGFSVISGEKARPLFIRSPVSYTHLDVYKRQVFNWPGMGRLAYESILRKDYPTLLGILFCSVFVVIIANVLTDFAYRFLDPKMRVGRR